MRCTTTAITVAEASGERGASWQVSIARPGEVSTPTYRLSEDGALLELRDMLFGAPRELVTESASAE